MPIRLRRSNQRTNSRRGAAVVELAIVSPVIVLLTAATIDISSMYYLRQTCKLAAYEGCRIGVTPKSENLLVENQAKRVLHGRRVAGYSITITPSASNLAPGEKLVVQVSAPCSGNLPLAGWFSGGRSITEQVAMVSEL